MAKDPEQQYLDRIARVMERALPPAADHSLAGMGDIRAYELPREKLNQFSRTAYGYVPAPATVPTLPAGAYTIQPNQTGARVFARQEIRTDDLVQLPKAIHGTVVAQVRRFWTMRDQFIEHGFMHKRGVLLYGPPGSGKTTTARIVAQNLVDEDQGVVFWGGDLQSLAQGLKEFREVEPDRPVVIVREDIDNDLHMGPLLLALLDGEWTVDRCVFICTTNHPEELPPTLLDRPSRFDLRYEIPLPDEASRLLYLESRHIQRDGQLIDEQQLATWAQQSEGLSFAHLRELVVSVAIFGHPLEETLKRLRGMKEVPDSTKFGGRRRRAGFALNGGEGIPVDPAFGIGA